MLESSPHGKITTASLAKHVGVSEAALYRQFPSKARMFEGLLEFAELTIFPRIRTILENTQLAEDRCYAILALLLGFCERNPGISRLLVGDALTGETERLRSRANQVLERIETQLKQVFREAEIREDKRTVLGISVTTEMVLGVAEGKVRQFVRSNFTRLPTTHWPEQWQYIRDRLFH
jgi:TetR/AcrR family transcriptional regulator